MSDEEKSGVSSGNPFTAILGTCEAVSFCPVAPSLLIGIAVVGVVVSFMLARGGYPAGISFLSEVV
jgi:hypothetical protein